MQAAHEATSPTRVAELDALAEFHREPIPYNLEALVQLTYIQRTAPNSAAVNQSWRHDLANVLYHLIAWAGQRAG